MGSGSGYLSAVFYHLVGSSVGDQGGEIVGIEHVPELVDFSIRNLRKDGLGNALDEGRIVMVAGDGRQGFPQEGGHPFHVSQYSNI